MGRDLLAEDFILKQLTASLIYPEAETGKKFWKRVYEAAAQKFKTTNIPLNTFNKVWIVPDKAVVYENLKAGTAYIVSSRLKVMLEADYLAMQKQVPVGEIAPAPIKALKEERSMRTDIPSLILREVVIPELTREVNQGQNFAPLRQVYDSLILAAWYKKKIRDSLLAQVYDDRNKIAGIKYAPNVVERIYQRYLQAFKKGVYNYIKQEVDPVTQRSCPRKYFSGGFFGAAVDAAMVTSPQGSLLGHTDGKDDLIIAVSLLVSPSVSNVDLNKKVDPALMTARQFIDASESEKESEMTRLGIYDLNELKKKVLVIKSFAEANAAALELELFNRTLKIIQAKIFSKILFNHDNSQGEKKVVLDRLIEKIKSPQPLPSIVGSDQVSLGHLKLWINEIKNVLEVKLASYSPMMSRREEDEHRIKKDTLNEVLEILTKEFLSRLDVGRFVRLTPAQQETEMGNKAISFLYERFLVLESLEKTENPDIDGRDCPKETVNAATNRLLAHILYRSLIENWGFYRIQKREIRNSWEKMKKLLSLLEAPMGEIKNLWDVVNWLNESTEPFKKYLIFRHKKMEAIKQGTWEKDRDPIIEARIEAIDRMLPKGFLKINEYEWKAFAETPASQQPRREILILLYPSETTDLQSKLKQFPHLISTIELSNRVLSRIFATPYDPSVDEIIRWIYELQQEWLEKRTAVYSREIQLKIINKVIDLLNAELTRRNRFYNEVVGYLQGNVSGDTAMMHVYRFLSLSDQEQDIEIEKMGYIDLDQLMNDVNEVKGNNEMISSTTDEYSESLLRKMKARVFEKSLFETVLLSDSDKSNLRELVNKIKVSKNLALAVSLNELGSPDTKRLEFWVDKLGLAETELTYPPFSPTQSILQEFGIKKKSIEVVLRTLRKELKLRLQVEAFLGMSTDAQLELIKGLNIFELSDYYGMFRKYEKLRLSQPARVNYPDQKFYGSLNRILAGLLSRSLAENNYFFEFRADEFDNALWKIKPLLKALGIQQDGLNTIAKALIFLNTSIKPFEMYIENVDDIQKDEELKKMLPAGFFNFQMSDFENFAFSPQGQKFKRAILTSLFPSITPRIEHKKRMLFSLTNKIELSTRESSRIFNDDFNPNRDELTNWIAALVDDKKHSGRYGAVSNWIQMQIITEVMVLLTNEKERRSNAGKHLAIFAGSRPTDPAMNSGGPKRGGIDLTGKNMDLKINNGSLPPGNWIRFHVDPAMLKRLRAVDGLEPVIVGFEPLGDLKGFLNSPGPSLPHFNAVSR